MEDRLAAIADTVRAARNGAATVPSAPLRVHIATMGCAKNEVDSAHMARSLAEAGCLLCDDADEAEFIVVNTCSFIQAAAEESIAAVFDHCMLPSVASGNARVVVAGCLPSRYGNDLAEALGEASAFVPCSDEDDIVSVAASLFPGRIGSAQLSIPMGELSVYVKVSEGCDRFCSFCTIPFIRGRYHSFTPSVVRSEVSRAVAAGAREVVLVGQDTGRWGLDLGDGNTLASLLASLAEEFPDVWFRSMYVQPEGVTDDLLDTIASHGNIASYIDVPFQHASAHILSAMNRKGSGADYIALVERIRACVPDVTVRTTLIAGFPGETEDDFDALCAFVEDAEFDYVGVFSYSPEEGTRAARLPGQLDEAEREERARRLRDVADAISHARFAQRIGSEIDVLVLGREEDGQLFGRAQCQAPDVDGVTYLTRGDIGSVVRVTVQDTLMYDMEGE